MAATEKSDKVKKLSHCAAGSVRRARRELIDTDGQREILASPPPMTSAHSDDDVRPIIRSEETTTTTTGRKQVIFRLGFRQPIRPAANADDNWSDILPPLFRRRRFSDETSRPPMCGRAVSLARSTRLSDHVNSTSINCRTNPNRAPPNMTERGRKGCSQPASQPASRGERIFKNLFPPVCFDQTHKEV